MLFKKKIKQQTNFDNLMRHILNGNFQQGWAHSKLRVKILKDGLLFEFVSLEDDSVIKELKINATTGDTVNLVGVVTSYELEFIHMNQFKNKRLEGLKNGI